MSLVFSTEPPCSSRRAAKTFEALGTRLIFVLGFLVYGVKADFPCKTQQIHWIGSPGRRYKCLECPDCPAGLQPSVPCGSSVAFGTSIHCVPCQLGNTYSDKYGKMQCEACTVCSKGKAIKKNCTLFSNAECDDKCATGFYPEPFIFDCVPCAKCCGDGKDEMALECANYENKCKVRPTPCTNIPTTKPADITTHTLKILSLTRLSKTFAATSGKRHLQTTTQRISSAMHRTTRPVRLENESTTLLRTHITKLLSTFSVPSTLLANRAVEGRVIASREKNEESNLFVILMVVLAFTMLVILGLVAFIVCERRSNLRRNDVATVERVTEQGLATSSSQVQINPTYRGLEQLENENQGLFDWMCLKLDNGRWWFRRDYERLAAKYKEISLEERNTLHDELQSKGSPSKSLMSLLRARYPNLPLRQFETLKEIGRNDIAQKLLPHVSHNDT